VRKQVSGWVQCVGAVCRWESGGWSEADMCKCIHNDMPIEPCVGFPTGCHPFTDITGADCRVNINK
jgi:hypothetical protein